MKLMALGIVSMSLSSAMAEEAPPRLDFAFEERVTLSPVVEMGETALGARRSIPITGGTVTGPKLKGVVQPGGWDFQLTYAGSHCTQLSADYFLKAEDGTPIHVLNEGAVVPRRAAPDLPAETRGAPGEVRVDDSLDVRRDTGARVRAGS